MCARVFETSQRLFDGGRLDGQVTDAAATRQGDDGHHDGHEDQRQQRDHDEHGVLLEGLDKPVESVHGCVAF